MVKYISKIRNKVKKVFWFFLDLLIYSLPIYYKELNKIPLSNWFKVQDSDYSGLYRVRLFKRIPNFFYSLALDILFQMDKIEMDLIRKKADLAILMSIAERTKNKSIKFQADILANEIKIKEEKNKNEKSKSLNEFIDYIELTFECPGTINPDKISASRAFSLYNKAIDKNKRLQEQYNKR